LALEITKLCGTNNLVGRAQELAKLEKYDVACSLIEFAFRSDPTNKQIAQVRADIYLKRSAKERGLMSRHIFKAVARDFYGNDDSDNAMVNYLAEQVGRTRQYVKSKL